MSRDDGRVYSRLYHDLIDHHPDVWHDRALRGDYAAALVEADQAWPASFLPSRLIADESIEAFARAGILVHESHGRYRLDGLDADRSTRRAQAQRARAARGGTGSGTASGTAGGTDSGAASGTDSGARSGTQPSRAEPSREEPSRAEARLARPTALTAAPPPSRKTTTTDVDPMAGYGPEWWLFIREWRLRRRLRPLTTKQRAMLSDLIRDYPSVPVWVREAPGTTEREVIDHVLERVKRIRADGAATADQQEAASSRAKADDVGKRGGGLTRVGDVASSERSLTDALGRGPDGKLVYVPPEAGDGRTH